MLHCGLLLFILTCRRTDTVQMHMHIILCCVMFKVFSRHILHAYNNCLIMKIGRHISHRCINGLYRIETDFSGPKGIMLKNTLYYTFGIIQWADYI